MYNPDQRMLFCYFISHKNSRFGPKKETNVKMDFLRDFRDKMKNLKVDLKSAPKMSLTNREGFFKNNFFSKKYFFQFSEPEKSLKFPKKKFFFQTKTKSKNPRGWLSSFLVLISNLHSDFPFYLENLEKSPFFGQKRPK